MRYWLVAWVKNVNRPVIVCCIDRKTTINLAVSLAAEGYTVVTESGARYIDWPWKDAEVTFWLVCSSLYNLEFPCYAILKGGEIVYCLDAESRNFDNIVYVSLGDKNEDN